MDEFKKADGETFDEYMMRIGEACSERKLTQNQAAELLNEATGSDYGECRYRKTYKSWKAGYDYAIDHANEETIKNELQRLKIEKSNYKMNAMQQTRCIAMLLVPNPLRN